MGKTILIVDDNRDGADTLAMVLEFLGHHTSVAYDGQQAVEIARRLRPDVVILDINMPVMDGYEAARTLRGDSGTARSILIALTAVAHPQARDKAREAGFDVHLTKPVAGDELAEVIERVAGAADAGGAAKER